MTMLRAGADMAKPSINGLVCRSADGCPCLLFDIIEGAGYHTHLLVAALSRAG
jgi:hypothetical protein